MLLPILTFPSGRAAFYVSQRGWGELGKRLVACYWNTQEEAYAQWRDMQN